MADESEIHPVRLHEADPQDVVRFVDDLVTGSESSDVTEKVAGQHLTVVIENNHVGALTKDMIMHKSPVRDARHFRFGAEITRPIIEVAKRMPLPNQVWRFEMVSPNFNHDYVSYKNPDIVFVEYTGRLDSQTADMIRQFMRSGRLLTRQDLRPNVKPTPRTQAFRPIWINQVRPKMMTLHKAPPHVKRREMERLKSVVGDLMEDALTSVVDGVSPVEGVVVKGSGVPFKVSATSFRLIQRVQLPLYSLFKLKKEEAEAMMANPTTSIADLRIQTGYPYSAVYHFNAHNSLYTTLRNFFSGAARLTTVDPSKFVIWMSPQEADSMGQALTPDNAAQVYLQLYKKIK